jgi:crotonobetainyl-CoA:carnitine CoA-transferase CaiB-like acyl-CoA transferase
VCRALGLEDYTQDERFATLELLAQPEHAAQMREILAARLLEKSTGEWIQVLEAHDVLCGEVLGAGEAYAHPQAEANGTVWELEHPTLGALRLVGTPVKLSETPGRLRSAPPRLGEHTAEVLASLTKELTGAGGVAG